MGELPAPVPGGWSAWGDWGPCSRSCGAGVAVMERRCDHPTPRHGGAYCLGERRRYRLCNTQVQHLLPVSVMHKDDGYAFIALIAGGLDAHV